MINTNSYLLRQLSLQPRQITKIENIESSVQKISKVLDSVLLMTKLDTDPVLGTEPVNLSILLTGLCDQLAGTIEQESKHISTTIAPNLSSNVYSEHIAIAFENILHNAIQYTDPGGTIDLSAHQSGNSVIITLDDNGVGIEDNDLPHVFERFYRVNKARTLDTITAGNGLGLSITKAIIEQHGGTISIDSEFGIGTTVTIALPIVQKTGWV